MKEKRRYFKIKAGRKILSIILTVAIVASNMTAAFAWSWDDKDNGYNKSYNGPYSHVSIAVGSRQEVGTIDTVVKKVNNKGDSNEK